MKQHQRNILLIAIILAAAVSVTFLIVTVTANFLIAYAFALLGIAGLAYGGVAMLRRGDSYPWIAAIPRATVAYLILEAAFSAAVVILEQLRVWTLPPRWFAAVHVVIVCAFAIRLILLHGGASHIKARGEFVKGKVARIKAWQADMELMAARSDEAGMREQLGALADALRYSDPMSHGDLAPIEDAMDAQIKELSEAVAIHDYPTAKAIAKEFGQTLLERNKKCKLLK